MRGKACGTGGSIRLAGLCGRKLARERKDGNIIRVAFRVRVKKVCPGMESRQYNLFRSISIYNTS